MQNESQFFFQKKIGERKYCVIKCFYEFNYGLSIMRRSEPLKHQQRSSEYNTTPTQ